MAFSNMSYSGKIVISWSLSA